MSSPSGPHSSAQEYEKGETVLETSSHGDLPQSTGNGRILQTHGMFPPHFNSFNSLGSSVQPDSQALLSFD